MANSLDLGKDVAGAPLGVWVLGGTALGGGIWVLMKRRSSKSASSSGSSSQPTTIYSPATSGDFSTDQAEAIYSDIRNLQGQETGFADTASNLQKGITGVSNQVTGVSQQISKIPAGPIGPQGPAGVPGAPAPSPAPPPPPPPPPPRPQPTWHEAVVHTDGKRSMNFYASEYGTSVAQILGPTQQSEPSDYNSPKSALHKYIVQGKWNYEVPAGYTLYVHYLR